MELFELAKIMLLGITLGIFTGMLPGVGIFTTVFLFLGMLKTMDAFSIILFYVSLICTTHYIGSVVAIYLGVPGEQTSLIACRYGFKIFQRKNSLGDLLISGTAMGSFIGSMLGIFFIVVSFFWMSISLPFFSMKIQLVLFLVIFIAMACHGGSKKILLNIFFIALGTLLGSIGFNHIQSITLTFGQNWLVPGLNPVLIILILFVIPNMIMHTNFQTKKNSVPEKIRSTPRVIKGVRVAGKYFYTVLRGSFVGSIMGLVPGVGTSACSQVAAAMETKTRKGFIPKVMAAEAANNSAVLTSIIPLLLFGIPILPSEAIILDILSTKQAIIGTTWFQGHTMFGLNYLEALLLAAFICNLCMMFLSCWGAVYLGKLYSLISPRLLVAFVIVFILTIIGHDSWKLLRWQLDLLTIIVLLPFMFVIIKKRLDTLPLVFSLLLVELVQKIIYYYIEIYY